MRQEKRQAQELRASDNSGGPEEREEGGPEWAVSGDGVGGDMRLIAWIYQGISLEIFDGGPTRGEVRFILDEPNSIAQAEKSGWIRAPWLDQPINIKEYPSEK